MFCDLGGIGRVQGIVRIAFRVNTPRSVDGPVAADRTPMRHHEPGETGKSALPGAQKRPHPGSSPNRCERAGRRAGAFIRLGLTSTSGFCVLGQAINVDKIAPPLRERFQIWKRGHHLALPAAAAPPARRPTARSATGATASRVACASPS
jgi:hypothetical protein